MNFQLGVLCQMIGSRLALAEKLVKSNKSNCTPIEGRLHVVNSLR